MEIVQLEILYAWLIRFLVHRDKRGPFAETNRPDKFVRAGGPILVPSQSNRSMTRIGDARGLHVAKHVRHWKLIEVVSGVAKAVFVDCRRESPTFGLKITLRLDENYAVFLPPMIANFFQAVEGPIIDIIGGEPVRYDGGFVIYRYDVGKIYGGPDDEYTISMFDPDLGIEFEIEPTNISDRDLDATTFKEVFGCQPYEL